ncbi:MAG TPA: DUF1552 domain-containing protein [Polyangiaceae bacterium]|nr:DUF1552 domain-containing protein [Polyangiaceae bacterium]
MTRLKDLKVSRRFALRGALGGIGVAMWLPVLDAMCNDNGTAFAQGQALPTSFGIWYWGNGIHADVWTPPTTGSGDAWQLSPSLQDFADVKEAMTLVTGLDMLDGQFKGHGWGAVYVLAGGDGNICNLTNDLSDLGSHEFETKASTQYMPTVDQTIADAIHTTEPFKSFEVGMMPFRGDVDMGTVGRNVAHRGPNDFLPPKREPTAIFDALFGENAPAPTGSAGSAGVPSDISFSMRKSALDAVLQEANGLKMTLGAEDAQRVDAHLEAIRALEQRLPTESDGDATGCKTPGAPPATIADITAKSQAINQLLVAALSCNLTRVFTHMWSGARSDDLYPNLQLNEGHHAYTHGRDGEEPRKIERYIMSQYADLARRMKATPLGAGTLLDNTLIYGVSELSNPRDHVNRDYHIVLMGRGGGKVAGNRHIRIPGRRVTELVLTLQQAMGLDVTTWGSWDKTSKIVSEILA